MTTIICGGRVIDPATETDRVTDVLIDDGVIREIGEVATRPTGATIIDAVGKIVCPGFVDIHACLREPGFEEDETIASGTAAALAGGFTSIGSMPDTAPVVDNRASAEFVTLQAARANNCNVFPLGTVTKERTGEELAEIGQLVQGGAVAFTDGHKPIANAEVMRRALEYTRMFDRPILSLPVVPELAAGGVMHEGFVSTLLGLQGIPAAAHDIMVGRDIALAELTDGRLHIMCLTTRDSVERIRRAKQRGIRITAEVTPHHLLLTDEAMKSFSSANRVFPPLVAADHVAALIEGVSDGTIDAICSDHTPLAREKKDCEIDAAPPGISSLETAVAVAAAALVHPGHIDWPAFIRLLTCGPAAVLGINRGTLQPGAAADVTVFDPDREWTVDSTRFRSRGHSTPFDGRCLRGSVETVLVGGAVRYCREATDSGHVRPAGS